MLRQLHAFNCMLFSLRGLIMILSTLAAFLNTLILSFGIDYPSHSLRLSLTGRKFFLRLTARTFRLLLP